jgi:hypothetical protein
MLLFFLQHLFTECILCTREHCLRSWKTGTSVHTFQGVNIGNWLNNESYINQNTMQPWKWYTSIHNDIDRKRGHYIKLNSKFNTLPGLRVYLSGSMHSWNGLGPGIYPQQHKIKLNKQKLPLYAALEEKAKKNILRTTKEICRLDIM